MIMVSSSFRVAQCAYRNPLRFKAGRVVAFFREPSHHRSFGTQDSHSSAASSLAGSSSGSHSSNNNSTPIVLPEREYGYRTKPFNWTELEQIIRDKDLARFSRSVEQEAKYQEYMRDMKRQWRDLHHFILHSKFGLEKRWVDGMWETPLLPELQQEPASNLSLNDFPYYTEPGIWHYVLWKIGGLVTDAEIEDACQEIKQDLGDVLDVLHWKNPPHLKSLPDIDHAHILVRRASNLAAPSPTTSKL
ncbi:Protein of unknown function (DUF3605) [Seminavis robusta]|uniref:Uncharacterized protein n=1 Tax=Seminavis robusta TaxID=568900 RepID=A0A9N8E9D9_9STRA|nr:Protein of unknown function (DUF3605) [Seminavis robusta]|eukprot:Sro693_g188280.1 Protein of unknown function (DUF3605) (246) ;mRNA; f:22284-23021